MNKILRLINTTNYKIYLAIREPLGLLVPQKGYVLYPDIEGELSIGNVCRIWGETWSIQRGTIEDFYKDNFFYRKGPQRLTKDTVARIIHEVSQISPSTIVEAGTGTGYLTANLLTSFPKAKIYSFEIREDHYIICRNTLSFFNLNNNLFLQNCSIIDYSFQETIDVIILDLPNSELFLEHLFNFLKVDGLVIIFTPNLTQVTKIYEHPLIEYFEDPLTIDLQVNTYKIELPQIMKILDRGIFSGFLTILRRIKG